MNKDTKTYITGHRGILGSAILENLNENGYTNINSTTSTGLDLRNQLTTNNFLAEYKPNEVFISAARIGGILANNEYPWDFVYDNLMIDANLINTAHENDVQSLILLA